MGFCDAPRQLGGLVFKRRGGAADRGEEGLGSDGSSVARPSLKRVSQRHRPGRERLAARVLHRAAGSVEPGGGDYKVPGQRAASFPTRRAGGGAGGVQSEGPAASRFTVLRRDSGEGSGTERAAFGFLRALADDSLGHGREHLGQRRGERPREAHAAPPAAPGGQPDFALPQDGGRQAAALARGWNSMAEPRPAVQGGEAELGGNLTTPQR